jgi:hypothetical protein
MKYCLKIIETYSKSVEIEARSEDEAFEKVREKYEAGEIKFDPADDFDEYEICPAYFFTT